MIKRIHFLKHGYPLCDFTREVPLRWPDGHVWAHCGDSDALAHESICPECLECWKSGTQRRAMEERGLSEYVAELRRDAARFNAYWFEMMAKEPEHFPAKMLPGEWDEQFRAWQESQRVIGALANVDDQGAEAM